MHTPGWPELWRLHGNSGFRQRTDQGETLLNPEANPPSGRHPVRGEALKSITNRSSRASSCIQSRSKRGGSSASSGRLAASPINPLGEAERNEGNRMMYDGLFPGSFTAGERPCWQFPRAPKAETGVVIIRCVDCRTRKNHGQAPRQAH